MESSAFDLDVLALIAGLGMGIVLGGLLVALILRVRAGAAHAEAHRHLALIKPKRH